MRNAKKLLKVSKIKKLKCRQAAEDAPWRPLGEGSASRGNCESRGLEGRKQVHRVFRKNEAYRCGGGS